MHSIRHNPATQLNAVFAAQPSKASSTLSSAPGKYAPIDLVFFVLKICLAYESDLFPDPYSMPPSHFQHNSPGSRPETFIHTIDAFPVKQVRQWQANRRGNKAFAESASSKPHSSNSSKSKLLLRLKSSKAGVIDHQDDSSSRLLARRDGLDAQTTTAHGNLRRSSSPRPWKRLLVLPVAYVRLRIGEVRYGYE